MSDRVPWLTISAPLTLPIIGFLVLSALGMGEPPPPNPRKPMQRTITMNELDQQHKEWIEHLDKHYTQEPIIRKVWDPATLSMVYRPEMKMVRKT